MPDHAGVYDRITVREYLEFFADAFRVPSINVVDAVLELTDLGKIQDRLVAEMSKGMKQRRRLRQVARDSSLGDQCLWSIRPLADAPGLRQVLRLHRRRDRPVVSADL
jgi:ABC-type transport system involved in cytochrome c biogenesis ATPase subunit